MSHKKDLEGYDPILCINDARNHVYRLQIDKAVLKDIESKERLFHDGRYEKYRAELMEFLAEYPKMSDLHVGIGNSFFTEGKLEKAKE